MRATGTANSPEERYARFISTGTEVGVVESELQWDQRHTYLIVPRYSTENFEFGAIARLFSSRDWLNYSTTSTLLSDLPVRALLDIKLNYRIGAGSTQISPYLEIRNLFNVEFEAEDDASLFFNSQPFTFPEHEFGRRLRLGVRIN